jgi:pyrroloquinoline quinone biosynthesis protein D
MSPKVRLRQDRLSARWWLLYPERGLLLNDSASRIAALCDGTRSLDDIIEQLLPSQHERERVESDVRAFLHALAQRKLLTWAAP